MLGIPPACVFYVCRSGKKSFRLAKKKVIHYNNKNGASLFEGNRRGQPFGRDMKLTDCKAINRNALSARLSRICALVLFSLVSAFLLGCGDSSEPLIISEVVSSNKRSYEDELLGSPDWIELHNQSASAINLQGYILTDQEDKYDLSNMLPDMTLAAGGYVLILAKTDTKGETFCLPFGLSKTGDTLCLINPAGRLIEKLTIPPLGEDVSYARRADGTFGFCEYPTPNAENKGEILDEYVPRAEKTEEGEKKDEEPVETLPPPVTLILNEIVSDDHPDGAFSGSDWVELFNPNEETVALEGFFLSDNKDNPDKYQLPLMQILPHGYALIPCSTGGSSGGIRIASSGEKIFLFDFAERLVDSADVPALLEGQSWARGTGGEFGYCGSPTPGSANLNEDIGPEQTRAAGAEEPLLLSEVLFRNTYSVMDSYGDHADYAELYNGGSDTVSLSEYYLSDDFTDPMKWKCPDREIQPGEYLLIFLTGKDSLEHEIHAPFSVSSSDSGLEIYHERSRSFQRIPWSNEVPKNTSMGLDPSGSVQYFKYPTPGYRNAAAITDITLLSAYPKDDVHISEVSAAGTGGDWIELRNGSDKTVDLTDWRLSDSENLENAQVLKGTLPAGGYAVFSPKAFAIAATGETLFLYAPDGSLRDVFDSGDLTGGITSGRTDRSDSARVFFSAQTKKQPNDGTFYTGRTAQPILSETGLYHSEPFLLELYCPDPDVEIRYTLDGSKPTSKSSLYTKPIQIKESVTVRAYGSKKGLLPSRSVTATYLFSKPHTVPVVCIACKPSDFKTFTRINSIGKYPRTDAMVAYYEPDGTIGTVFPAEINPRGNQSIKYPQKSLSIHLRTRLGQGSVNYPFWGAGTSLDYGTLILRNGSQDHAKARLRDSFALNAVINLGLDSARTRPVAVYVNGEYYGIMDFNEGSNQDYLVTHYSVDPSTIDHISMNQTVRYGSNQDFLRVRKYARSHNLSNASAFTEFSKWVDTDYIIDYVIAQTFFCNYDVKNQSYWATHDYKIRWRPVFYDIDRCFTDGTSRYDLFSRYFNKHGVVYDSGKGLTANMDLYAALRDSPEWCDRFVRRYAELLVTDFSVKNLQALLDRMAAELRPEMQRHISRFRTPSSMEVWEASVASMRKEIPLRHAEIQTQICQEFKLSKAKWNSIMQAAMQNVASEKESS